MNASAHTGTQEHRPWSTGQLQPVSHGGFVCGRCLQDKRVPMLGTRQISFNVR
jgi:hypothetical protein